jgi:hypothetical protein
VTGASEDRKGAETMLSEKRIVSYIETYQKNIVTAGEIANSIVYELASDEVFQSDFLHGIRRLPEAIQVAVASQLEKIKEAGFLWRPFLIGPGVSPNWPAEHVPIFKYIHETVNKGLPIAEMKPRVISELVSGTRGPNEAIRENSLIDLALCARGSGEAIETSVELLADESASIRWRAVYALSEICSDTRSLLALLRPCLQDSNSQVRRAALEALGRMGRAAADEIDHINAMTRDPDGLVRRAGILALGEIEPHRADIGALIDAIGGSFFHLRRDAVILLGKIGSRAAVAIPQLIAALRDPIPDIREHAAMALGRMGSIAHQAIPALLEAQHDPEKEVAKAASEALAYIKT